MMIKAQKVEFVEKLKKEIKTYKTIGILPIQEVPDRLTQKAKNLLKPDTKIIVARKRLIMKVLESDPQLKRLGEHIDSNFALIMSNRSPEELNEIISSNRIKLSAKPNQISPDDISIEAGETTIAPGQAVTDLKTAGIDVQIQKGKVVISKSKVLVKKGTKISVPISKALKMLDIMPFEAGTQVRALLSEGILYHGLALKVNAEFLRDEISRSFAQACAIASTAGIITEYNIKESISKAYISALGLGLDAKVYEPEIAERLLAQAVREAMSVNALPKAAPEAAAPDTEKKE
jgi:large subunit ribosomal protein L10